MAPRAIQSDGAPIPAIGIGPGASPTGPGGATSTAGSTHPVAGCVVAAVIAAEPHSAAAGAPALRTDRAAQGLACCGMGMDAEAVAATAPAELKIKDAAAETAAI